MAYKKGDEMVIKWKTKLLLGKLSANFDGSMKEIDVTSDSSAGFEEILAGDLSGSVSFSGVYDPAHASGQGANGPGCRLSGQGQWRVNLWRRNTYNRQGFHRNCLYYQVRYERLTW